MRDRGIEYEANREDQDPLYTPDSIFETALTVCVCALLILLMVAALYLLPATSTPGVTHAGLGFGAWLAQRLCAIFTGHDRLRHWERRRITLRCTACGHDTAGVELTGRPRPRFTGGAR